VHSNAEAQIVVQPGRRGDHHVYRVAATPHPAAWGVASGAVAGLVFAYGAIGSLRRRCARPAEPDVKGTSA
jgi:hypothetical protein